MKVVVALDSFKGSVDSRSAGAAVRRGVLAVQPTADVRVFEMADGGEGTLSAILSARGGEEIAVETVDSLHRPVTATYGVLVADGRRIAVIEAARTIGLAQLESVDADIPPRASSYGLGVQFRHALQSGPDQVLIGLGGTASTDGGTGFLSALGLRLVDDEGSAPRPGTNPLWRFAGIESTSMPDVAHVEVCVLSDVTNPLLGPLGAAAVFGPQKGATPGQIATLELRMAGWARSLERLSGRAVASVPGAGAAGGIGAALVALGARLEPGFDRVAALVGLPEAVAGADLVFTGEGRLDAQTGMGKGPVGVARIAREAGALVIALAGHVERGPDLPALFTAVVPIHSRPRTLDEAMDPATTLAELEGTAAELARLTAAALDK
jgi:glycerate kinase